MSATEITTQYVATVKVTTQTYALHIDTYNYEDGTSLQRYVLRSPKNENKYWIGVHQKGYMATKGLGAGVYEFQTIMGTKIQRKGNPVQFFIAGDMIERIK